MRAAFEEILHTAGVSLVLTGHNHMYERTWPLFNGTVYNGSSDEPYTNPGAAVHIVSAAGGNGESMDSFDVDQPYGRLLPQGLGGAMDRLGPYRGPRRPIAPPR